MSQKARDERGRWRNLCRITAGETIDPDLVETIWLVADTLNEVKGKDEEEIF